MSFQITAKHIQDRRLSEIDFSTAAGFWIPTIDFSNLPHAAELREDRHLSRRCIWERANKIRLDLARFDLFEPEGRFVWADAKNAAASFASIHYQVSSSEGRGRGSDHFQFLQNSEPFTKSRAHDASRGKAPDSGNDQLANLFPNMMSDTGQLPDTKLTSAFVIVDREITEPQHWSLASRLPETLIAHHPGEGLHILLTDIHERRHIRNIRNTDDSFPMLSARNVDSDLAGIYSFKNAGIGDKTCRAHIHARYSSMLFNSSKYWFAAALEAHMHHKEPKDFRTTFIAVCEIKVRLAMYFTGKSSLLTTSESLQQSIDGWQAYRLNEPKIEHYLSVYNKSIAPRALDNPGFLYTAIRHLTEHNAFDDRFTRHLAVKILDAANYFNSDLTSADNDASVARMRDQMGGRRLWRTIAAVLPRPVQAVPS